MAVRRPIFILVGIQLLLLLLLLVMFTPRYVPSAALARAIAPHADSATARSAMARAYSRRCWRSWRVGPDIELRKVRLYSWENDEGLIASTTIDCVKGGRCSIDADVLFPMRAQMLSCRKG